VMDLPQLLNPFRRVETRNMNDEKSAHLSK
jgi:hypothetical protein